MAVQDDTQTNADFDLANAIYDRRIRDQYEPACNGQYVVIDLDSEDFEVDEDNAQAFLRLRERRPEGRFWTRRVADPIGARFLTLFRSKTT